MCDVIPFKRPIKAHKCIGVGCVYCREVKTIMELANEVAVPKQKEICDCNSCTMDIEELWKHNHGE